MLVFSLIDNKSISVIMPVMWSIAMTVNTAVWCVLGVFLVYSTGLLFLEGNFHQFFLALLLWGLSNLSEIIFTCLA